MQLKNKRRERHSFHLNDGSSARDSSKHSASSNASENNYAQQNAYDPNFINEANKELERLKAIKPKSGSVSTSTIRFKDLNQRFQKLMKAINNQESSPDQKQKHGESFRE